MEPIIMVKAFSSSSSLLIFYSISRGCEESGGALQNWLSPSAARPMGSPRALTNGPITAGAPRHEMNRGKRGKGRASFCTLFGQMLSPLLLCAHENGCCLWHLLL